MIIQPSGRPLLPRRSRLDRPSQIRNIFYTNLKGQECMDKHIANGARRDGQLGDRARPRQRFFTEASAPRSCTDWSSDSTRQPLTRHARISLTASLQRRNSRTGVPDWSSLSFDLSPARLETDLGWTGAAGVPCMPSTHDFLHEPSCSWKDLTFSIFHCPVQHLDKQNLTFGQTTFDISIFPHLLPQARDKQTAAHG